MTTNSTTPEDWTATTTGTSNVVGIDVAPADKTVTVTATVDNSGVMRIHDVSTSTSTSTGSIQELLWGGSIHIDPPEQMAQEVLDEWLEELDTNTLAAMVMLLPHDNALRNMARYKLRSRHAHEDDRSGKTDQNP